MEGRDEEKELIKNIEATNEIEVGEISLHALKGYPYNEIIKVEGQTKGKKLMILIDGGSTHSFIDIVLGVD